MDRVAGRQGSAGAGSIPTVLVARSTTPAVQAAPSRSTIAPVPTRLLGVAALLAMAMTDRELNGDDTQRLPELTARSGAPCHTQAAFPPGFPTSACRWKVPPEGRASTHDDENGAACAVEIVLCGVCATVCDALLSGYVVACENEVANRHACESLLRCWSILILLPPHLSPSAPLAPAPLVRPPLPAVSRSRVVLTVVARILPILRVPTLPTISLPSCLPPRVSVSAKLAVKRSRDTLTSVTIDTDSTFQKADLQLGATDVCARHIGGNKHAETPVASASLLRPYTHHVVAYSLLVGAVGLAGSNDVLGAVDVRA